MLYIRVYFIHLCKYNQTSLVQKQTLKLLYHFRRKEINKISLKVYQLKATVKLINKIMIFLKLFAKQ